MSKYKRKLNIKWFATTKLGIEELAKNTNFGLTSSDFRLMFYLLSKIDEDNKATVPKNKQKFQMKSTFQSERFPRV